ncbi:MAG: mismatch-specific DNA-glycosylase [Acidimicrobiia bacterium]|nr:mismatch-specific DNA-glycosylase [Acidimicrobiia bacterium]
MSTHTGADRPDDPAIPTARHIETADLRDLVRSELPLVLAELHRGLDVDAPVELRFDGEPDARRSDDGLADSSSPPLQTQQLIDVVEGAGFAVDDIVTSTPGPSGPASVEVGATRLWQLPDHVGADMRMLLVGLNPSPAAADRGVGFARPGNRFWPAMAAAGLATVDRDPRHLLREHRIGMTDLVKRTTRRADELSVDEYRTGLERLERLVAWTRPGAVCMIGLGGWRAAVDRTATTGVQERLVASRPVYVMPNPSGLNANHQLPDFVNHLQAAAALGSSPRYS